MTDQQCQQLRRKSCSFLVHDEHLFKRFRKRWIPSWRVIDKPEQRLEILKELNNETEHCGQQETYDQMYQRYQWKRCTMMSSNMSNHVKNVSADLEFDKNLYIKLGALLYREKWESIFFICLGRLRKIVMDWLCLQGTVRVCAIKDENPINVAEFIYEDVVRRHGCLSNCSGPRQRKSQSDEGSAGTL